MLKFTRRNLLQASAMLPFGIALPMFGEKGLEFPTGNNPSFWNGDYVVHKNVDVSKLDKGIIKAKVNGSWQEFPVRGYSDGFLDWNLKNREQFLGIFLRMFSGDMKAGKEISFDGAHNAMVASYGRKRDDSVFTLNNAVKGTGLLPKPDIIKTKIEELNKGDDSEDMKVRKAKIEYLLDNYKNKELWDRRTLISLELYSTPKFQTHTFLNVMENPLTTLVFLHMVSYELRCICYLIDPKNPKLTDMEKDWIAYSNGAHSYFHGKSKVNFITSVYFIIEEFDNSPARVEKGRGRRTVP